VVVVFQVDDMLAQAQSVSRSLLEQRRIFSNVQDKLVTVGERFPVINGLLNAVRRKKSKVRELSDVLWLLLWRDGQCSAAAHLAQNAFMVPSWLSACCSGLSQSV
jgi:hypothetical protein